MRSFPDDVSPDGVFDLAGNVSEWMLAASTNIGSTMRIVRGGNWYDTSSADLHDYMAVENLRPLNRTDYSVGLRCVIDGPNLSATASP